MSRTSPASENTSAATNQHAARVRVGRGIEHAPRRRSTRRASPACRRTRADAVSRPRLRDPVPDREAPPRRRRRPRSPGSRREPFAHPRAAARRGGSARGRAGGRARPCQQLELVDADDGSRPRTAATAARRPRSAPRPRRRAPRARAGRRPRSAATPTRSPDGRAAGWPSSASAVGVGAAAAPGPRRAPGVPARASGTRARRVDSRRARRPSRSRGS